MLLLQSSSSPSSIPQFPSLNFSSDIYFHVHSQLLFEFSAIVLTHDVLSSPLLSSSLLSSLSLSSSLFIFLLSYCLHVIYFFILFFTSYFLSFFYHILSYLNIYMCVLGYGCTKTVENSNFWALIKVRVILLFHLS